MNLNLNSRVTIGKLFVEKEIPTNQPLDLVLDKYNKIRTIGLNHGFIVPEILSVKDSTIVFQRLDLDQPLKSLVHRSITQRKDQEKAKSVMRACGNALATIHTQLVLTDQQTCNVNKNLKHTAASILKTEHKIELGDSVFLHSDFSLNNIFELNNQLVIIDPLPNNHSSHCVNEFGSRYMDISLFINSINRQIGLVTFFNHDWKHARELRKEFLKGYQQSSNYTIDQSIANAMSYAIECQISDLSESSFMIKLCRKLVTWLAVKNELHNGDHSVVQK